MTEAGHVWIVTEQALFANNTPVGTLGLKLKNDNESDHIHVSWLFTWFSSQWNFFSTIVSSILSLWTLQDSVYVLARAIKDMMLNETITEAPKDCDDSGVIWETGKKLFHYLKTRAVDGKTGRVVTTLSLNTALLSGSTCSLLHFDTRVSEMGSTWTCPEWRFAHKKEKSV